MLNNKLKTFFDFLNVRTVSRTFIKLNITFNNLKKQCYDRITNDIIIIKYRKYVKTDKKTKIVLIVKKLVRFFKKTRDFAFHVTSFVNYTNK